MLKLGTLEDDSYGMGNARFSARLMVMSMTVALMFAATVYFARSEQPPQPGAVASTPAGRYGESGADDPGDAAGSIDPSAMSASQAITTATNMGRIANARRLQTAVAQFAAEYGKYPSSLSEIPPEMLDFSPRLDVYRYFADGNGYRIEVILNGAQTGENIFTENGVSKYVLVAR